MNEPSTPGATLTFLYYFSMTTLIVLLIMSQGMGVSLNSQIPYQIGISLGLVTGLIGTYFNRSVTLTLNTKQPKTLIRQVEQSLAELGFQKTSQVEDYVIYRKSGLSSLFSGKIFLKPTKNSLICIGRSRNIKSLERILG